MTIDPREFRNTLGLFATGITVVTTNDSNGEKIGVTINSFASVSLEPPLVLFSLKTESPLTNIFLSQEKYNICVLADDQENVSNLFASHEEDKFSKVDWKEGENGTPVLNGTLATLECKRAEAHMGGDHTIFVGQVTNIEASEEGGPLLYYKGGYKKL